MPFVPTAEKVLSKQQLMIPGLETHLLKNQSLWGSLVRVPDRLFLNTEKTNRWTEAIWLSLTSVSHLGATEEEHVSHGLFLCAGS